MNRMKTRCGTCVTPRLLRLSPVPGTSSKPNVINVVALQVPKKKNNVNPAAVVVKLEAVEKSNASEAVETCLKCKKCGSLVFSPVKMCLGLAPPGFHIFCGLCQVGLENCNLDGCVEEPLIHCGVVEHLLKSLDTTMSCKNVKAGCKQVINAWEVKEHLEICKYNDLVEPFCRPVKCCEKNHTDCGGMIVGLDNFLAHLTTNHQARNLGEGTRITDSIFIAFDAFYNFNEIHGEDFNRGVTNYFEFDGCTFLLHEIREHGMFFRYITVFGKSGAAGKYRYSLTFKTRDCLSKALKVRWELPVLSVHHGDFEKAKEEGRFATYHYTCIKDYADEGVKDGKPYDYSWSINIEMRKDIDMIEIDSD